MITWWVMKYLYECSLGAAQLTYIGYINVYYILNNVSDCFLVCFEALENAAMYRSAKMLLDSRDNLLNIQCQVSFMPSFLLRPKFYCVFVSCLQACVWRRGCFIVPSQDCIQVLTFICVLSIFCQVCVISHWHSCFYMNVCQPLAAWSRCMLLGLMEEVIVNSLFFE